jgi:hypothetical protein
MNTSPALKFIGVAVVAGILVMMFAGSGGGFLSALGDSARDFGSGSGGGPRGYQYRGFMGSNHDTGWRDALDDKSGGFDLLQEKVDNWNRSIQWDNYHNARYGYGDPKECTSKETWTARCGYHR